VIGEVLGEPQTQVPWAIAPGRLRKSGGDAWTTADCCFQRYCLQPNGRRLAILRPCLRRLGTRREVMLFSLG